MRKMSISHYRNKILGLLFVILTLFPLYRVKAYQLPTRDEIIAYGIDASVEEMLEELPETAKLDDPYLLLVNRDNVLDEEIPMEFAVTPSGHYFDARIEEAFYAFIEGASLAGYDLQVISAYRSMEQQAANFDARYAMYLSDGLNEDDAYYYTSMFVAPYNASEHSTGLAFDLLGYDYQEYGRDLHQIYREYGSAIWMAEHAPEYGFILRYPEGKTEMTGYEYEPWHFRYVGHEHAEFMHNYGLTLEEYLALLALKEEN